MTFSDPSDGNHDATPMATDGDYDAFAVFDSVPGIVHSLDVSESRFMSIFLAFIGVGSVFIGSHKAVHLPFP
jgi:hypothetical protein